MQLFATGESCIATDLTFDNSIEMVDLTRKKERELQKVKSSYYAMMQDKVKNKAIKEKNAENINKECDQYHLYEDLMPRDNYLNTKFHYLAYIRDPRIETFKLSYPSIFAYFPNKYKCTANSIIAINQKGLCYDLHKKHPQ